MSFRRLEQSCPKSATHGKIALAIEHNWVPITSTSTWSRPYQPEVFWLSVLGLGMSANISFYLFKFSFLLRFHPSLAQVVLPVFLTIRCHAVTVTLIGIWIPYVCVCRCLCTYTNTYKHIPKHTYSSPTRQMSCSMEAAATIWHNFKDPCQFNLSLAIVSDTVHRDREFVQSEWGNTWGGVLIG